ncbi:MAG: large subunit ribosomal protein L17 [Rhodothermales bacterium]|jgi:large subunit ribosomal protein L17
MRHRKRQLKLGKKPAHVRAILTNQVCSLINEERIKTTIHKAKATRSLAEKMVTLAKRGDLHNRRLALSRLHNQLTVRKLFNEIGPRFADREGGYTRIVQIGQRRGDGAKVVYLEWIGAQEVPATKQRRQPEPEEVEDVIDAVEEAEAEVVETEVEETEVEEAEVAESADEAQAEAGDSVDEDEEEKA